MTVVGFNWDDLKAWGIQASRHPPTLQRAIEVNKWQVAMNRGLIPPLQTLEGTSVGGPHASVFFRQANHEVKCVIPVPDDGWIVTDGHLDRPKLAAQSPDAAEALQRGLA